MACTFLGLEPVLRSNKEPLSLQEVNLLFECRDKAVEEFSGGLYCGGIATWLATVRLSNLRPTLGIPLRFSLTFVLATACGLWRITKSCEESTKHILSLEGSQIQRELVHLLLKRHDYDPWVQQCLSKHFYAEEVYVDSSEDKSVLRWRFRNYYGYPPLGHSQVASYREKIHLQNANVKTTASTERTELNQVNVSESNKQMNVSIANDAEENVFGTIFGLCGSSESNVPVRSIPSFSSRRKAYKEKRAHRGRRRNHQEE